MPFEAKSTTSGGLMIGADSVTVEDGVAVFAMVRDHPDWDHVIIDVSISDSPFVLPRNEELDRLHLLVRTLRDLRLGKGFKIALVQGPRSRARVADFIDLARSIAVDIEVTAFDSIEDALHWVDASISDS